eukprot:4629879-Lingulodinium_polyedra.AAC.1
MATSLSGMSEPAPCTSDLPRGPEVATEEAYYAHPLTRTAMDFAANSDRDMPATEAAPQAPSE